MSQRILTLDELKGRSLEDVLHEVAHDRESLTVVLDEENIVIIQPSASLKPLPILEGFIPDGWKDAIYGE